MNRGWRHGPGYGLRKVIEVREYPVKLLFPAWLARLSCKHEALLLEQDREAKKVYCHVCLGQEQARIVGRALPAKARNKREPADGRKERR